MELIDKIRRIHEKLKEIRVYLVKLNQDRRKCEIVNKKIIEGKEIYTKLDILLNVVKERVRKGELELEQVDVINDLTGRINKVFDEIVNFPIPKDTENENISMMAEFDIKVALSMLPVMDDSEDKTRQLIDAIELYDSMINNAGKVNLINVVLKTKLSTKAKLRLNQSYISVKELIKDMKSHLLTQKSDTALQMKLATARQGDNSIEEFGKELEQLFFDLTISQAQGNETAYAVLKPLNEKNAIKIFADGLRNQRLSTIISSRNVTSLKDAIRTALDEDPSRNNIGNAQIMSFTNRGRGRGGRNNFNNNYRGQLQQSNNYYARGNYNNNNRRGNNYFYNRSRGNQMRGNLSTNNNRNFNQNSNHSFSNYNSGRNNSRNQQNKCTCNNVYNFNDSDTSENFNNSDQQNQINYFFREDEQ